MDHDVKKTYLVRNKKKNSLYPSFVSARRLSKVDLVVISDSLVVICFVARIILHRLKQKQKLKFSIDSEDSEYQWREPSITWIVNSPSRSPWSSL
jgi:hypothetical protein